MFSQIVNPITNKKVNITSKTGKKVLNNYINIQSGGSISWSNRDHFYSHGGFGTRQRSDAEISALRMLNVHYNGPEGFLHNYTGFWSNPGRRYDYFGIWDRVWIEGYGREEGYYEHKFMPKSLNEFIRYFINQTYYINDLVNAFIRIIELRFLDSKQRSQLDGETQVFRVHNNIILGMVEAFWTLTEQNTDKRMWLNRIDFLEISRATTTLKYWKDVSVGLTSSIINYQLPPPEPSLYGEEEELIVGFDGMSLQ